MRAIGCWLFTPESGWFETSEAKKSPTPFGIGLWHHSTTVYGLLEVGNGQAACGFSVVCAAGAAVVDAALAAGAFAAFFAAGFLAAFLAAGFLAAGFLAAAAFLAGAAFVAATSVCSAGRASVATTGVYSAWADVGTSNVPVTVTYAQTGTAATAGAARVTIVYRSPAP